MEEEIVDSVTLSPVILNRPSLLFPDELKCQLAWVYCGGWYACSYLTDSSIQGGWANRLLFTAVWFPGNRYSPPAVSVPTLGLFRKDLGARANYGWFRRYCGPGATAYHHVPFPAPRFINLFNATK